MMNDKDVAKNFTDVIAWQKAHEFVLMVYKMTSSFPKDELYGLTSQFRRAAVSIAANLAEGFRKLSVLDKLRFYNIAQGSADECSYYLILSKDLGYNVVPDAGNLLENISRSISAYCSGIRRNMK
jgi:four helix bundle protein